MNNDSQSALFKETEDFLLISRDSADFNKKIVEIVKNLSKKNVCGVLLRPGNVAKFIEISIFFQKSEYKESRETFDQILRQYIDAQCIINKACGVLERIKATDSKDLDYKILNSEFSAIMKMIEIIRERNTVTIATGKFGIIDVNQLNLVVENNLKSVSLELENKDRLVNMRKYNQKDSPINILSM